MSTSLPTLIVFLAGTTLSVFFAILLSFSFNIRSSISLEKFLIAFFMLLIAGGLDAINIFQKLSPVYILSEGQAPGRAFVVIVMTFAATLLVLSLKLKLSFKKFSNGLIHLVLYNPFLIILILFTPISALWSLTPFFTFARGMVFIAVITVGIYIGSCYQWNDIFNFLKWSFAFAMAQSAFIALLVPSIGVAGKGWQGSFNHAGTLGLYAALSSMLWLIQLLSSQKKDRLRDAAIFGLSFFVLKQTSSATGLILFFQGMSVILTVSLMKKLKPKLSFVVMLISTSFIILITYSFNSYYDDLLAALGKSPDLTGRGEFWPQLIQKVIQHPLLGYGFEGFWLPWKGALNPAITIFNSNFYVPPHAHNGFLDLALSLGFVGIVLFTITYLSCVMRIFQNFRSHWNFATIPLILLLFIATANASGPGLWTVGFHSFLLVLISTRLTLDTTQTSIR